MQLLALLNNSTDLLPEMVDTSVPWGQSAIVDGLSESAIVDGLSEDDQNLPFVSVIGEMLRLNQDEPYSSPAPEVQTDIQAGQPVAEPAWPISKSMGLHHQSSIEDSVAQVSPRPIQDSSSHVIGRAVVMPSSNGSTESLPAARSEHVAGGNGWQVGPDDRRTVDFEPSPGIPLNPDTKQARPNSTSPNHDDSTQVLRDGAARLSQPRTSVVPSSAQTVTSTAPLHVALESLRDVVRDVDPRLPAVDSAKPVSNASPELSSAKSTEPRVASVEHDTVDSAKPRVADPRVDAKLVEHLPKDGPLPSHERPATHTADPIMVIDEPSTTASKSLAIHRGLTNSTVQAVDVATRIVAAMSAEAVVHRTQPARLEVELDPPELGRVSIELTESKDGVMARITVSRESTAQLVDSQLSTIRASLDEAGVQVSDFQVGRDDASHDQRSAFENHARTGWVLNKKQAEDQPNDLDPSHRTADHHGHRGTRIDVRI